MIETVDTVCQMEQPFKETLIDVQNEFRSQTVAVLRPVLQNGVFKSIHKSANSDKGMIETCFTGPSWKKCGHAVKPAIRMRTCI